MTNDHDRIDTWLERDINPLMPRQGTLDRIRRTARRRKATQVGMAAAGCAVIIAAAAIVPQLAHHSGANTAASHATTPAAHSPTVTPSAAPSTTKAASPNPIGSPSTKPRVTSLLAGGQVPAIFHPTSVTFVGGGPSGLVGAVIGQGRNRGARACATQYCTSLAATENYGSSWKGVSAPLTGQPSGATGVSQLRFANDSDGWAYGPALFVTTDGGTHWLQETTFGQRVVALEASQGSAYAIFARCAGTGSNFAADCTSFTLYTSADGSTNWTPVTVPPAFQRMQTTTRASASITIPGSAAFVLGPAGQLLRGNLTSGIWTRAGSAPCRPGGAQRSGLPADAHLATLGPLGTTHPTLVLACNGSTAAGQIATIYTSATGLTWSRTSVVQTITGQATSLAGDATGYLMLATTAGIDYSANRGKTWKPAQFTGGQPSGGFSYVGMTSSSLGVAVPADAALGEVFVTTNGGLTWQPSPIRS